VHVISPQVAQTLVRVPLASTQLNLPSANTD